MSSTEVSKNLKTVNPGPLDAWWGPYENVAAACAAIPNTQALVDGVMVNFRQGKTVGIITNDGIVDYAWLKSFTDAGLVKYMDGYLNKNTELGTAKSKNQFQQPLVLTGKEYNVTNHVIQDRSDDDVFRIFVLANSVHSISGLPTTTPTVRTGAFLTVAGVLIPGTEFSLGLGINFKDNIVTPNQDCFFVLSLRGRISANSNYSTVQFEDGPIHTSYDPNYTGVGSVAGLPIIAPSVPAKLLDPISLDYLIKQLSLKISTAPGFGLYPDSDKSIVSGIGSPSNVLGANLANPDNIVAGKEVFNNGTDAPDIRTRSDDSVLYVRGLTPGSTYTLSGLPLTPTGGFNRNLAFLNSFDGIISTQAIVTTDPGATVTLPISCVAIAVSLTGRTALRNNFSALMFNAGSSAQPFVPYSLTKVYAFGTTAIYNGKIIQTGPLTNESPVSKKYVDDIIAPIGSASTVLGTNIANPINIISGKEVYNAGGFTEVRNRADDSVLYVYNLTPGQTYSISGLPGTGTRSGLFIRANGTVISATVLTTAMNSLTFVMPAEGVTFVVSLQGRNSANNNFSALMFNIGAVKSFVPYATIPVFNFGVSKLYNAVITQTEEMVSGSPVSKEYLEAQLAGVGLSTKGKVFLLLGDSITETQPSGGGTRDNWPNYAFPLLQATFISFARSGAAFKDRTVTDPRQVISQQIMDAIATGLAFDGVIVSMLTNDGPTVTGDYTTAMGKTTLASLDRTNLFEAMRWAFWTIKTQWNVPLYYCTPLQRADTETATLQPLYDAAIKMSKRYGATVIDCTYESGIVREFEVNSGVGRDLYDGLHPGVTGRAKQGKLIVSRILSTFRS